MLSYAAQFTVKKTISEVFGSCPISKLKRIANALQLPTAGDLIRCIKSEGFYGQAKEFEKYEIKVNRATVSEILEDANNCPTLYSVAKSYNGSTSNYYSFLNRESDVTLSYISSKLPKDYDIAEILDELEEKADRRPIAEYTNDEEYCYEGIPSSFLIITWIMLLLTGKESGLSSSYFDDMTGWYVFNPFMDTLEGIAALWEMNLKDLIVATEQDSIKLSPSGMMNIVDNSKTALLKRLITKAGFQNEENFTAFFPLEKRASLRHLFRLKGNRIQATTLLSLLKPFKLKLSDIIE